MSLTSKQRKDLKRHAHSLKPVVQMGQAGLTPAVLDEIEIALHHHELIKIKIVAEDRPEKQAIAGRIAEQTGSDLVQIIGHTGVFFRLNPDRKRYS